MEGINHSDEHSAFFFIFELIFVIFHPTNTTVANLLSSCIRPHHLLYLRQH